MQPIAFIRLQVFGAKQDEFASIAGCGQSSISRYEQGQSFPGMMEMARIRAEAKRRGLTWSDSWFFEIPEDVAA